jgi:acetyl esterase/lipase
MSKELELIEAQYAERDSGPLMVTIVREVGAQNLPILMEIHGGGWCGGARRTEMSVMAHDRALEGYLFLDIDYRLAPFQPYPKAIEDVHDALRWAFEKAPAFGGDPSRIGIFGMSAGAHLAAMLALTSDIDVKCAVCWGGPYDYTDPADPRATAGHAECVLAFLGACRHDRPDLYTAISPVLHLRQDSPPLLVIHGDDDNAVSVYHAESMQRAAAAAGAPVDVCILRGAGHVDPGPADPDAAVIWSHICNFMARHLHPAGPIRPLSPKPLARL